MKKIGVLSACIFMILLLGVIDIRQQNGYQFQKPQDEEKPVMAAAETELMSETAAEEAFDIRVLIRSDNFESEYHDRISVAAQEGFCLSYGGNKKEYGAGEEITFTVESAEFAEDGILRLLSKDGSFTLPGLQRDIENLVYEGSLEIRKTEKGLLVINELPFEEYLYGVIPSEMPSDYPAEALKAQAVCARTYARKQMQEGRAQEFYADVDDSVSYQVYNNQSRSEATDAAVEETKGIVLTKEGELLDALYYSTSCGMNLSIDLSDESVFAAFLSEDNRKAYEAQEPWYRWSADLNLADFEDVIEITVTERAASGRIEEIEVTHTAEGEKGNEFFDVSKAAGETVSEKISGEYQVRKFLDSADPLIYLQNGDTVNGMGLLPSAFFIMIPQYNEERILVGYHLKGGGYGHGEGMSQNGAKGMAEDGITYEEILRNYYGDVELSVQ